MVVARNVCSWLGMLSRDAWLGPENGSWWVSTGSGELREGPNGSKRGAGGREGGAGGCGGSIRNACMIARTCVSGPRGVLVSGCCGWRKLAFVDLRWPSLAYVGLRWPLRAYVGLLAVPSIIIVRRCRFPLLLSDVDVM